MRLLSRPSAVIELPKFSVLKPAALQFAVKPPGGYGLNLAMLSWFSKYLYPVAQRTQSNPSQPSVCDGSGVSAAPPAGLDLNCEHGEGAIVKSAAGSSRAALSM